MISESDIKQISRIYHFDSYQINGNIIKFTNFTIDSINIDKMTVYLELDLSYPADNHVWIHIPNTISSLKHLGYHYVICDIHDDCIKLSYRPDNDVTVAVHNLIKGIREILNKI